MADSDSSSISSTYHSDDGEVTCFLSKTYDFSELDLPWETTKAGSSQFPTEVLNQEEANQILSAFGRQKKSDGNETIMYPAALAAFIQEEYKNFAKYIKEESVGSCALFYPPGTLVSILGQKHLELQPNDSNSNRVLFDVCVFSHSQTTLVLTLTQGGESSCAAHYNSQISRSLIDVVSKNTGTDISVVHGVIDEEDCNERETFLKKLSDFKKSARLMSFPPTLYMTEDRLQDIMKCVLGLHGLKTEVEDLKANQKQDIGTESLSIFPTCYISEKDLEDIRHILSSRHGQTSVPIYPRKVNEHLTREHPHMANRMKELPGRENSVIIAGRSLLYLMDRTTRENPVSKSIVCDVCVFSAREPVLVLTITSGDGKEDKITEYNSQLTRFIVQSVRRNTRYSFSAVHGVVEESLCQTPGKFEEKISQLQRDAHVMSNAPALVMTKNKCVVIAKPILKLMTEDKSPEASPTDARPSINMEYLLKRIEELEINSKREKEELKDQIEKIQQDYLADTRLSLLMRPRSSSVSESIVSGYGSTEDLEAYHKHADGTRDKAPQHGTVRGKYTAQTELTTESIQKGDLELVQYNRDITLHQACEEGKLNVVKYILSQGVADINCRGTFGRTPVMAAVRKGEMSVFDYLVRQGCDQTAVDEHKNNILHVACIGGHVDMVKHIISLNIVSTESRGYVGRTPLMTAAVWGQVGVFGLLVREGCDLTAVDEHKSNILHLACFRGHVQMVKYLMTLEAVKGMEEMTDIFGHTPIEDAETEGHGAVVNLFKETD